MGSYFTNSNEIAAGIGLNDPGFGQGIYSVTIRPNEKKKVLYFLFPINRHISTNWNFGVIFPALKG